MQLTTWEVGAQEANTDDGESAKVLVAGAIEDGSEDADLDVTDAVDISLETDDDKKQLLTVSRKVLKSFCERVLFQLEADKKLRGE